MHKKSGQTTEEVPGLMRLEKAKTSVFPRKRNDDDDKRELYRVLY
jgi:hypothetical protein